MRKTANIVYGGAAVETVNLLWHQHWLFSIAGVVVTLGARVISNARGKYRAAEEI